MKHLGFFFLIILACLCQSCGKGFNKKLIDTEEIPSGTWELDFQPLNSQFGFYSGHGFIMHYGHQFWPHFRIYGPASSVEHFQFLHEGERCPQTQDDKNHDGYIDFSESYQVVGKVLIPLDRLLNDQVMGSNKFPRIKPWQNSYYYSASSNSHIMMKDLRRPAHKTHALWTKLYDDKLQLEKRVVLIYGTLIPTQLPESFSTYEGFLPHQSVPVACSNIIFRGNFASSSDL